MKSRGSEMSTLPSERPATVRLKVIPDDRASEITITRGAEQIAREQGPLERDLPVGIYRVTARVGFDFNTWTVVLDGSEPEKRQVVPVLEFPSAAPLKNTKYSRPEHATAAKRESRKTHVSLGKGSWVFLFARDRREGSPARAAELLQGVRLRSFADDVLVDLEAKGIARAKTYPWAACNISLDPGAYRLTVDLPSGERLSQTVVATLGWQTQLFLLADGAPSGRVDLNTAAILFYRRDRPATGFNPDDSDLRDVEFARYSLASDPEGLRNYARQRAAADKPLHPMLGIFAAHQLIASGNGDRAVAKSIVADLMKRGFGDHPDVRTLSVALDGKGDAIPFTIPPTLRRSWELLLRCTVRRPELIPPDSLAGQVATRVWGEEPWLVWREPAAADIEIEGNERAADLEERLDSELGRLGADWKSASQLTDWQLTQVSSLGLPLRQLETLLAKVAVRKAARDAAHGEVAISTGALRDAIVDGFSVGDIDLLRSDLEVELAERGVKVRLSKDVLGGEGTPMQVQKLIDALQRINQVRALVEMIRKRNPVAFDRLSR